MKNSVLVAAVLVTALAAFAADPPSDHVAIVMMENTSYSGVVGSSYMPYFNSLASNYALATKYYANTHPSIGNYFELTTGQIITNSDGYMTTVTADNVVRHLLTAGKTWKSYAESLPSVGYTGGDKYPYVRHHNPLSYFSDVVNSSAEKMNLVPFTQFATDLANNALPNYMFIVPNLHHDMHDCPVGMSTCTFADKAKAADAWLKTNIAPLLSNSEFKTNGVLVIVWDEAASSDTTNGGGRVAMVMAGAGVKQKYKSTTFYQHQSTLRMMMESLGTGTYPGAAAKAPDMAEMFGSNSISPAPPSGCTLSTVSPSVTICSPTAGATVTSSVHVVAGATSSPAATQMSVWVDGAKQYETSGSTVDTTLTLGSGSHQLTVQAYNGSYFKSTETVTVSTAMQTACAAASPAPSVTICAPANNSTVSSPVQVLATALGTTTVQNVAVWVDGVKKYQVNGGTVNTSLSMTSGTHRITVQAYDGAYFQATVDATVP